jgi:hypothetical protein
MRALARLTIVLAWLSGACSGDPDQTAHDAAARPDAEGPEPAADATAHRDGGMLAPRDGSMAPDAAEGGPDASRDGGTSDPSCALPAAFDVGRSYARELHVAVDGDVARDGSSAAPLRTIRAAAERATPGTRVIVHAGSYPAVGLGRVQGDAAQPIAFAAEGAVTIDAASGVGWAMSDAAYVVIEGFTIVNAPVHGMNLDDGSSFETPMHHLVLRKLTIRNAGSGGNNDCIKMSGVDHFWVLESDVSDCDHGEIIDMVGCHHGVISGNVFHDTVVNGVQTKGGSADILIHANRFENIPGRAVNAGGSTGLEFFRPQDAPHEAARIHVLSNVFVRNGSMGGAAIGYVGCDGCVFAHNTVIEPRRWVARILQETTDARFVPSRNGLFVNNVIVLAVADLSTYVNVGANTAPETFAFGNNAWFATDQPANWAGPTLGSGIPPELGSIVQRDPLLVNRAGGDYRPTAGSPLLGAARALDFALPPAFDGRCQREPAAIGAFAAP